MAATDRNRGGKREAAAFSLAAGRTVKVAADKACVSERTLFYWLTEEEFRARVNEVRGELFTRAVGTLCRVSGAAARELGRLLKSEDEKVRLAAAKAVLEIAPRLRETADLAGQLDELRAAMEEIKRGNHPAATGRTAGAGGPTPSAGGHLGPDPGANPGGT